MSSQLCLIVQRKRGTGLSHGCIGLGSADAVQSRAAKIRLISSNILWLVIVILVKPELADEKLDGQGYGRIGRVEARATKTISDLQPLLRATKGDKSS